MQKSQCEPATKEELKWIEEFKKVCKRCPKSLWLFSGASLLCVMKTPEDDNEMGGGLGTGVNPDNIIDTIPGIRNDGGDW